MTIFFIGFPMRLAVIANSTITPAIHALHLPRVTAVDPQFEGFIHLQEDTVSLLIPRMSQKPFCVDFVSEKMRYRSQHLKYQKELITRACVIKGLKRPTRILDATAGFGRDAFILAACAAEG